MAAADKQTRIKCNNCGATTDFVVTANLMKCAFCGSTQVIAKEAPEVKETAERVLGFSFERAEAMTLYQSFLGSGWFRPGDLGREAALKELKAIYIPAWAVSGRAQSSWSAEVGFTHTETRETSDGRRETQQITDWQPSSGNHMSDYADVLVSATDGYQQAWLEELMPFQLNEAKPYQAEYLLGRGVSGRDLNQASGEQKGREIIERKEREACRQMVPGNQHRNLNVSTSVGSLRSTSCYLPLWVAAYEYKGKANRFAVNGESGKSNGNAPVSMFKVLVLIVVLIAIGLGIYFLVNR